MADAIVRVVDERAIVQIVDAAYIRELANALEAQLAALVAQGGVLTDQAEAYALAASIAASTAELAALTAPNVYATKAEGLAAVGEGLTFWSNEGGELSLYRDVSGVATKLATPLVSNGTTPTLTIGTNRLGLALDADGGAMTLTPTVPGHRGEIQVIPNDGPDGETPDPWAGGEVTILMRDTQFYGYTNSSAFTMRGTRDGSGNGVAWTLRSIKNGTDALYPLEIDTMDGQIQCRYNTDGTTWFLKGIQIGGTLADPDVAGYDTVPAIRLGPQLQPAIDLEASGTDARTFRLRSLTGTFAIADLNAGAPRFSINSAGLVKAHAGFEVAGNITAIGSTATLRLTDSESGGAPMMVRSIGGKLNIYNENVGEVLFETDSATGITHVVKLGVGTDDPVYRVAFSNGGAQGIEFGPGYGLDTNIIQQYDRVANAYLKGRYAAAAHEFAIGTVITIGINASGHLVPGTDGGFAVGQPSLRFSTYYGTTGTIDTSDENAKQQIEAIPDAWLDAWGDVQYCRFKLNSAVAKKGDAARWHVGLIAQRVHEAFAARDLDAFQIGLLCYDEWEAEEGAPEVRGPDDKVVIEARPAKEAGSAWSLRYSECAVMEAAFQRRHSARLEARIAALEAA